MASPEERMAKMTELAAQAEMKKNGKEAEAEAEAERLKQEAKESKGKEREQIAEQQVVANENLSKLEAMLPEMEAMAAGVSPDSDEFAMMTEELNGCRADIETTKKELAELNNRKALLDAELGTSAETGVPVEAATAVEVPVEAPMEQSVVVEESHVEEAPKIELTAEQIKQDDEAMATYIDEKDRLRKSKDKTVLDKVKQIEDHPEKITEFTGRIKEKIPTPDKAKQNLLFEMVKKLAQGSEEFAKKFLAKCVEKGIIKEGEDSITQEQVGPVLLEMEDEIVSTGDEKERYPLRLAEEQYDEAQSYLYKNERSLKKLGKEGEDAMAAVTENYLNGVEEYLNHPEMVRSQNESRGLGQSRPLSRSIPDSLRSILKDMEAAVPETKRTISDRIRQIAEKAKTVAKGDTYTEKYFDDIAKSIGSN